MYVNAVPPVQGMEDHSNVFAWSFLSALYAFVYALSVVKSSSIVSLVTLTFVCLSLCFSYSCPRVELSYVHSSTNA